MLASNKKHPELRARMTADDRATSARFQRLKYYVGEMRPTSLVECRVSMV